MQVGGELKFFVSVLSVCHVYCIHRQRASVFMNSQTLSTTEEEGKKTKRKKVRSVVWSDERMCVLY